MRTSSGNLKGLVKSELYRWWNDSKSILLFFSVAWPIMLEGLELVAMYLNPIYPIPLLRDKAWNWTNPWSTWCPGLNAQTTDFSHDYCYGSNIGHFGGPYSIMWYWTMYVIALGGRFYPLWNNLTGMLIINMVFTWRLRRRYPGLGLSALPNTLYAWISLMFLAAWPQILLTLFFTTGSLLTRRVWLRITLLSLAVLYRLPILAPAYVWNFILHYSLRNPWNYIPYSLTATIWIFGLVSLIGDVRRWKVAGKYAGAGACLGVLSFVGGWVALIYQEPGEATIASDWPIRIIVGIVIVSSISLIGVGLQRRRGEQPPKAFEPEVLKVLKKIHGDIFIDIGANRGQYAARLANHFSKVIAVEPDSRCNIPYRNNLTRYYSAFSDRAGERIFFLDGGKLCPNLSTGKNGVPVMVETFDQCFHDIPQIDLVKIDVEGEEFNVLKGAERSMDKIRRILVELHIGTRKKELVKLINANFDEVRWLDDMHIYGERT